MNDKGLNLGNVAEAIVAPPLVDSNRYPADLPHVMDAVMNSGPHRREEVQSAMSQVALQSTAEAKVFAGPSNIVVRGLPL